MKAKQYKLLYILATLCIVSSILLPPAVTVFVSAITILYGISLYNRDKTNDSLKSIFKKAKYFLQLRDGIWSVPLAFIAFWFVGIAFGWMFGYGTGSYDPAFLQPLFLAIVVVVGATNAAILGLWFNFRSIHRYLYGKKNTDGTFFNPSKADLKKIDPLHKLMISLFIIVFFIAAIILVFIQLI